VSQPSTLGALVETSHAVAATRSRSAKVAALSAWLRTLAGEDIEIGVGFLIGEPRQGKLGAGSAVLRAARDVAASAHGGAAAFTSPLTLADVDQAFARFAATRGSGSAAARAAVLRDLFARATEDERDFVTRLVTGELRQGALGGIMLDAIADAASLPKPEIRRAAMFGPLAIVAREALTAGGSGLIRFELQTMSPIAPMLAQSADDVTEAIEQLGEAAVEWKLDGARIQAHKRGGDVRIFTRSLNDVTAALPEIVDTVRGLGPDELVLDGEAIALDAGGRPRPFQDTMRRFGRKVDVPALRAELPLSAFFFDILRLDADVLADRPARDRFAAMNDTLPEPLIVPRLTAATASAAQAFVDEALARGHEGVMAKALGSPYEAGNRGASWLKIKSAQTLDLVVLAAEWGHGRRRGWLSNLHLGARDPRSGGFVMLGKTFKGMTDALLEWQTQALLEREIARDQWTVYVRPELVVEIAYNNVQASSQYPGGLTLRFARVKRYRADKRAEDADTIDTVRQRLEI
jgi:DNA ligase-1